MTDISYAIFVLVAPIMISSILILAIFHIPGTFAQDFLGFNDAHKHTVMYGAMVGLGLFLFSASIGCYLAIEFTPDQHGVGFWITSNIAMALASAVAGGIVAMAISPFNKSDVGKLNNISATLSVFVTGFFIGRIDKILDNFMNDRWHVNFYVLTILILCLLAAMGGFLVTFISRVYGISPDKTPDPQANLLERNLQGTTFRISLDS